MAQDKSYGSGKSRTAANSSARRRVAAGKLTKGKKYDIKAANARRAASPLGQLADTVLGFALPVGKVRAAAAGLRAAGKASQAAALEARAAANTAGKYFGGTGKKSQGLGLPMDRAVDVGGAARMASESLYPKLPSMGGVPGAKRTFDKYYDALDEGASRFSNKKSELLKLKRKAGLTDPKNPNSTYPGVSGSTMGQFTKFPKRGR